MNRKRHIRHTVFLVFILLLILIAWEALAIWNYGKTEEARPADVVIVLGAATYGDQVSPVFRERINHGIALYEAGYADKIILTGGYGEGNAHSDACIAGWYAVGQGVDAGDILLEEASTITWENIENAKAIMEEQGFQTAILVSDPLHMKRAMDMAGDAGIEAYSSPTPTTMYRSTRNKLKFLAREVLFSLGYKVFRLGKAG